MKVINNRVLVKPATPEEKTAGGLIIPDSAKEKPQRGEVIAVGNGTLDESMSVAVGDNVIYGKFSGQKIEHEGEEYVVLKQDDILVILN